MTPEPVVEIEDGFVQTTLFGETTDSHPSGLSALGVHVPPWDPDWAEHAVVGFSLGEAFEDGCVSSNVETVWLNRDAVVMIRAQIDIALEGPST